MQWACRWFKIYVNFKSEKSVRFFKIILLKTSNLTQTQHQVKTKKEGKRLVERYNYCSLSLGIIVYMTSNDKCLFSFAFDTQGYIEV